MAIAIFEFILSAKFNKSITVEEIYSLKIGNFNVKTLLIIPVLIGAFFGGYLGGMLVS